jgi:TonB family protein
MTIPNLVTSALLGLIMIGLSAADPISDGAAVKTKPRLDPASPLKPAGEHDLVLSRLLGDVMCKVKLTVNVDGSLDQFSIAQSSGIPEIDQLCLRAFVGGRLLPATENGVPVSTTIDIPITWHPPRK